MRRRRAVLVVGAGTAAILGMINVTLLGGHGQGRVLQQPRPPAQEQMLPALPPSEHVRYPIPAPGSCGIPQPAFCDTFDHAAGTGNRSGDLAGEVWGVSRISQDTNIGGRFAAWAPVQRQTCGTTQTAAPEHDVAVCNGQFVEAVNDNGQVAGLAAYPKQPFDIAGRTGTVTFDVSNNTQGMHAAWPVFVYTDQPVPAPYQSASTVATFARNSFGFSLAGLCGAGADCGNCPYPSPTGFTVDSMFITTNYALSEVDFTTLDCAQESTSVSQLNHIEVRLSQSQVQVWATDAGQTTLKEIAEASNVVLPLSRGLIWLEDVHYNGDKFGTQRTNTFVWDNVGFDGPALPRDLTFDVLDNLQANSDGTIQLGWIAPATPASVSLATLPIDSLGAATAALVAFNWFALAPEVPTVSVNGGPLLATPWPSDDATWAWRTIAVPVPLAQLKSGANLIRFQAPTTAVVVANVDVILVGAGGQPGPSP